MKNLLISLIVGAFPLSVSAQGVLGFANRVGAPYNINAPVFDTDCQTGLGPAFLAQFYAGPTQSSLEPVSPILTFIGAGYIDKSDGEVGNDAEAGQIFYVQMRAWPASAGKTYEAAVASGGKYGFSNLVPEAVRIAPGPPEWPVGLQSFCLIPEPSPLAYFVLAISTTAALKRLVLWRLG